MAETFGEADVILRVRLDELQRQLNDSERMVMQSTQRVQDAQVRAAREVASNSEGTGISGGDVATIGAKLASLTIKVLFLRKAYMLLTAAGSAVASTFASIAAVFALPIFLGDIIRLVRNMPDAFQRAKEALLNLDLKETFAQGTLSVRNFAHAIPLVGFAVRGLERSISEVSELLGGPNWTREIDALAESTRRAKFEMAELKLGIERTSGIMRSMRDATQSERRRGLLQNAPDEVARVRLEERFNQEDIKQAAQDEASVYHDAWQDRLDKLREENSGLTGISDEEFESRSRILQAERVRVLKQIEDEKQKALRESERNAMDRIADTERQQEVGAVNDEEGLFAETRAARLLAAGETFKAQQVQLEAARIRAVNDLILNGNEERIGMMDDYYDAQHDLIRAREQERLQAEREFQERRAEQERRALERKEQEEFNTLQTNERLRSQILQARMQQAGDEVAAQQEAIRQRFQEQIDQLERDGNRVGADLSRTLRDLELKAAESQQQGRRSAMETTRQRISRGEGFSDKQQMRVLVDTNKKIEQNTRPRANREMFG